MTGLYIHIPFCVKKCAYCDFYSRPMANEREYVRGILRELKAVRAQEISTVYIGGGTPTALPSPLLCEILRTVHELELIPDAEVTVEANPGTVDAAYLSALKNCGVTRLSFGVQTTHPHLLRALGRIHSHAEFLENFRAARAAGFSNINVDLMFALPSQTPAEWRETLQEIIALAPEHISAYSLTLAENTPLAAAVAAGEVTLPDDTTDREMYHETRRTLAGAGFTHYEISNFAKPGFESRHNVDCWTMRPYIGIGEGAHSFDGKSRSVNVPNVSPEVLTDDELIAETIILGLRMMRGVDEREFSEKFGRTPSEIFPAQIAQLKKDGLLASENDRLFLTPLGMDFANRVFCEFLQ